MTKILLVNDQQHYIHALSFMLEKKGSIVELAKNGEEALEKARQNPPDLIVADILMPVMDGFTLCREWQSDSRLQNIPFIFFTANHVDEKDKELGLKIGATRFIPKPSEPILLCSVLEELIAELEDGQLEIPTVKIEDEQLFLKQYNERLVLKLEENMLRLEEANQHLEAEVAERTAELSAALEKAREADRIKSQFISDLNHELRAPLNNLSLYLSFMNKGPQEKRPKYLDVLFRETKRLQWLISQLLVISSLDTGSLSANLEPVDINQLIATLVNDRRHLVRSKGLHLSFPSLAEVPPVLADSNLIFQVLTNLLSNSINYTKAGGEIVIFTAVQEKNNQDWVTVTVKDYGLGISKEDQEHLFERFFRGKAAEITKAAGTGLGLSICREIIQQHGGDITVKSQVGQGSSFTIWLKPMEKSELEFVKSFSLVA